MKAIPTLDNDGFLSTMLPMQLTLDAGDELPGPGPGPLDLYYQPDTISLYKQPSGDLYKRPGSP